MDESKENDVVEELPSSKLGTKEYWDEFYSRELNNFSDSKDEGEVWFGHTRMMKVIKWILNNKEIKKTDAIVDIGCGNGVMLLELADEGFEKLCGLDYSQNAIELAQNIAIEHNKNIQYSQVDFLDISSLRNIVSGTCYDVCHDKGTYDAISLRPDDAKIARRKYIDNLKSIMSDTGCFVITSCNWTLDELKQQFESDFMLTAHIPAPSFQFGGSSGSTVTTAVFSKL